MGKNQFALDTKYKQSLHQYREIMMSQEFEITQDLKDEVYKKLYYCIKTMPTYSCQRHTRFVDELYRKDTALLYSLLSLPEIKQQDLQNGTKYAEEVVWDSAMTIYSKLTHMAVACSIAEKYNLLYILNYFIGAENMTDFYKGVQMEMRRGCRSRIRMISEHAYQGLQRELAYLETENDKKFLIEYASILAGAIRSELQAEAFLNLPYYGTDADNNYSDGLDIYNEQAVYPVFDVDCPLQQKAVVQLDWNTDILISPTQSASKLRDAVYNIAHNGFVQKKDNYLVTYFKGLHIAIAENGYHHLSVAGLHKAGCVASTNVVDFETHFNDLQCEDGKTLFYKGEAIASFPDTRIAMIFLLEKFASQYSK